MCFVNVDLGLEIGVFDASLDDVEIAKELDELANGTLQYNAIGDPISLNKLSGVS